MLQNFSDKPLTKCQSCTGKLHKLVSQSTFHLKGTGWYVTDYANKSAKAQKPSSKNRKSKPADTTSSDTGSDSIADATLDGAADLSPLADSGVDLPSPVDGTADASPTSNWASWGCQTGPSPTCIATPLASSSLSISCDGIQGGVNCGCYSGMDFLGKCSPSAPTGGCEDCEAAFHGCCRQLFGL